MKKIIISILHYGSEKNTLECLKSLENSNLENLNITTFVLDNGTEKEFRVQSSKFRGLNLEVLRSNYNAGFSGGHNLIYEKVQDMSFDYFLILNNDCVLDKNCLKNLIKGFEKNRNVGAVAPKIYFTKGYEFHKSHYKENERGNVLWYGGGYMDWKNITSIHMGVDEVDKGQYDSEKFIDFATGACLMLSKETLKKVGLFDEKYFLYFEDADLSQRILIAGFKLLYNPKAVAWHNNAGSSGSGSSLHDYYLTRNRLLFGIRYAPLRSKIALFRESLGFLKNGRIWQKKGVVDFYLRRFEKGSWKN